MFGGTIYRLENGYEEFLKDESRSAGCAQSISFPQSEEDIKRILTQLKENGEQVTVQGARTGITAGAVPRGGHILNLSRMNKITGLRCHRDGKSFLLTVQPGVLLKDIRQAVAQKTFNVEGWSGESMEALELLKNSKAYFFPPDPTETSASIGGMAACNASGARSFKYGSTREYIESLRILLVDGSALYLRRGVEKARGRLFNLLLDTGTLLEGTLPDYGMPDVKNASGYYVKEGMDLIHLFIGSEGTLGILTEIEIRLIPAPPYAWGITAFFPSEEGAVDFVRALRGESVDFLTSPLVDKPAAIEFFDCNALNLLRGQKESNPAFSEIPALPPEYHTAVYFEYDGEDENRLEDMAARAVEALTECGGSEDATWLATGPREMEKMHFFRHAVPEAVNLLIGQRNRVNRSITKLGTDMAVPDHKLGEVMALYNQSLAASGLKYVKFGHIGNNHIHVNILSDSAEEYDRGRELYLDWGDRVARMGGTVSAEHGIGKLKVEMLRKMYGHEAVRQMLRLKRLFDPDGRLNRGNLFGE
ncbi:MAG: FAD-binding oxidoreductase [Clostridiales bacterium]|nr:FAD-binding oxidoreductase [Eubacteriales bacterium]MDH7566577.1 FAD-binding oxidoreductase [Clostridiales bacterium]